MRLRLLPFVVLFVLGFSGCAEPDTEAGAGLHVSPHGRSGQSHRVSPAAAEVVEPTGVVTLKRALGLALEHNPELKAFSWDVRIAEADRLQAGLRPNPYMFESSITSNRPDGL